MTRFVVSLIAIALGVVASPRAGFAGSADGDGPAVAPSEEPAAHEIDVVGGLAVVCRDTSGSCNGNAYGDGDVNLRVGISDEVYAAAAQTAEIGRSVDGTKTTGLTDLAVAVGWLSRGTSRRLGFEVGTTLPTGVAPFTRSDALVSATLVASERRGNSWAWLSPTIDATTSVEALRVRAGVLYREDGLVFLAEANVSQQYGPSPDLDLGGRVIIGGVSDDVLLGVRAEYADASIIGVVIGMRTNWLASASP